MLDGTDAELVVLLDENGAPSGAAPKADVHTQHTPLHSAFSFYGFRDDGCLLLARRALSKKTWPGVWSNTCCGHPLPGEAHSGAVARRLQYELALSVSGLALLLPNFRYRAVSSEGIVENEVCPVYFGRIPDDPTPRPSEVQAWSWVDVHELVEGVRLVPFAFSPWLSLQLQELADGGHL
jgi:isopentenyl-diphosphate delta-isomerase